MAGSLACFDGTNDPWTGKNESLINYWQINLIDVSEIVMMNMIMGRFSKMNLE